MAEQLRQNFQEGIGYVRCGHREETHQYTCEK